METAVGHRRLGSLVDIGARLVLRAAELARAVSGSPVRKPRRPLLLQSLTGERPSTSPGRHMDVQIMADNIHDAAVQGRDDEVSNQTGSPSPPAQAVRSVAPPLVPCVPLCIGQGCGLIVVPCMWCGDGCCRCVSWCRWTPVPSMHGMPASAPPHSWYDTHTTHITITRHKALHSHMAQLDTQANPFHPHSAH